MEDKLKNALDNFVDQPEDQVEKTKVDNEKKVILNKREGLIERVDKVFVTEDGRQLLREQY
jgi:hypothetical protein